MLSIDENIALVKNIEDSEAGDGFFMADLYKVMAKMHPFDRFLIQRILIDGEKPGDILDEAREFIEHDGSINTNAQNRHQFAGYIYTRYNRVRSSLKKQMKAIGYGE